MEIKNFAIFKNEKATGNQPQYNMVGKDDNENKYTLASVWEKDYNGKKFFSGVMKDEFTKDDGTKLEGFVIIPQSEYKQLIEAKNGSNTSTSQDDNTIDYPENDLGDLPF